MNKNYLEILRKNKNIPKLLKKIKKMTDKKQFG